MAMKKIIIILSLIILSATGVKAQHYRGFVDFMASYSLSQSNGSTFDGPGAFVIGGTSSHGVQVSRNCFVGVGGGFLSDLDNGGSGIPVFMEGRWDFFRGHSICNFFASLKLGYQFGFGCDAYMKCSHGHESRADYSHDAIGMELMTSSSWQCEGGFGSGLYVQPSIGVRLRLTDILGVNFALSYIPMPMVMEHENSWYREYGYDSWGYMDSEHGMTMTTTKFISHRIALTVGLDF